MLEGDRHRKRRKLLMPPFHGEKIQAYGQLICDLTEKIFSQLPPDQSFIARAITQDISLQVIDRLIYSEIAERRAEGCGERQDILSLLMSARDEDGQPMSDLQGRSFADRELRDELMTLMFAGHETTATAMAWAL
jgi:cytochrome P450